MFMRAYASGALPYMRDQDILASPANLLRHQTPTNTGLARESCAHLMRTSWMVGLWAGVL